MAAWVTCAVPTLGSWRRLNRTCHLFNSLWYTEVIWRHISYTVECRYNAVQYYLALYTSLQDVRQNINQRLKPLTSELCSVFREYFGENWPLYNGTAMINIGSNCGLSPDNTKQLAKPMLTYRLSKSISGINVRAISLIVPMNVIRNTCLKITL